MFRNRAVVTIRYRCICQDHWRPLNGFLYGVDFLSNIVDLHALWWPRVDFVAAIDFCLPAHHHHASFQKPLRAYLICLYPSIIWMMVSFAVLNSAVIGILIHPYPLLAAHQRIHSTSEELTNKLMLKHKNPLLHIELPPFLGWNGRQFKLSRDNLLKRKDICITLKIL